MNITETHIKMTALIFLTAIIIGLAYAAIEGYREANMFHYLFNSRASDIQAYHNRKVDIHKIFFAQRLLVLLLAVFCQKGLIAKIAIIPCALLMFSLIHDGVYFIRRHTLNGSIYFLKFKDESSESTAVLEFTYKQRFLMFIVGLGLTILTIAYLLIKQ